MPLLPYAHSGWMVSVLASPGHMSSTVMYNQHRLLPRLVASLPNDLVSPPGPAGGLLHFVIRTSLRGQPFDPRTTTVLVYMSEESSATTRSNSFYTTRELFYDKTAPSQARKETEH